MGCVNRAEGSLGYQMDFAFVAQYAVLFGYGILVTIAFTVGTVVLGVLIGLVLGIGRLSRFWLLNLPLVGFIEIFRCTPVLVQLVWFYYALPVLAGIQIPAVTAGVVVLSFYAGAFYAEIFRGGIISIDRGQWDAGNVLALTPWQIMRCIVLPQATRRMLPPFMSQCVMQLKNTSLVSTIAVPDLLYQGTLITAATYRPLEVYTIVAVIYFVVLFPITVLVRRLEIRLQRFR